MLKHLPLGRETPSGKKDQRHPDLIIHNLTRRRGSSLAIDISIANPFSQVDDSNPRPLAAALSRETDKINKHAADCSKLNLAFHLFVMDAYGGGIPSNTVQYVSIPSSTGSRTLYHQTGLHPTQLRLLVPEALCDTLDLQYLQGKATARHLLRKVPPFTTTTLFLLKQHTNKTKWTFCSHIYQTHSTQNALPLPPSQLH